MDAAATDIERTNADTTTAFAHFAVRRATLLQHAKQRAKVARAIKEKAKAEAKEIKAAKVARAIKETKAEAKERAATDERAKHRAPVHQQDRPLQHVVVLYVAV